MPTSAFSHRPRSRRIIASNMVTRTPVRRRKLALRLRQATEKGWDIGEAPSLRRFSFDSIRVVTGQAFSRGEMGVWQIADMHFHNGSNRGTATMQATDVTISCRRGGRHRRVRRHICRINLRQIRVLQYASSVAPLSGRRIVTRTAYAWADISAVSCTAHSRPRRR